MVSRRGRRYLSGKRMDQYIEFVGNHPILSIIWLALVAMLISSWFKSKFSAIRQIDPQQVTLLINREDGQVVDIRAQKNLTQVISLGQHTYAQKRQNNLIFQALKSSRVNPLY